MNADERANAEREEWLSHAQSWANTHSPDDQPAAQLLGRRYLALDALLTAVEKERDAGWEGLANLYTFLTGKECERRLVLGLATSAVSRERERAVAAEKEVERLRDELGVVRREREMLIRQLSAFTGNA